MNIKLPVEQMTEKQEAYVTQLIEQVGEEFAIEAFQRLFNVKCYSKHQVMDLLNKRKASSYIEYLKP